MLPKIEYPLFEITIPSMQKQCLFRPFLVKEEKILLMAQQSGENRQIILAIKQVINNCLQDDTVNVDDLTMFDLEYIFIKLRASSIDNNVTVVYIDSEDDKEYKFDIDIDQLQLTTIPLERHKIVDLKDGHKVKLKYITADALNDIPKDVEEHTFDDFLLAASIESIYSDDHLSLAKEFSYQDLIEWIDQLSIETKDEMMQFIEETPHILYEIKYTNSLEHERTIRLTSLRDFFTWG